MSSFPSRMHLTWRTSIVLVSAGGLLAVPLWTIPNWKLFFSNLANIPALWQIPANRAILLILLLKICSPLLIMMLISCTIALYQISEQQEADRPSSSLKQREHETIAIPASFYALPVSPLSAYEAWPQRQEVLLSAQPSAPLAPPAWMETVRMQLPQIPDSIGPVGSAHLIASMQASLSDVSAGEQPAQLTIVDADVAAQQTLELPEWAQEPVDSAPSQQTEPAPSNQTALPSQDAVQATSAAEQGSNQEQMPEAPRPLLSIRLLKEVSLILHGPQDKDYVIPLTTHAKRVQLLAYIACRRGELIDRDKILEQVFGWNLPDEDATEDKLSERFDSHKKLLRRKIREVVAEQINKPAGTNLIDPDIDPFVSDSHFWGLSGICRVDDLEAIETEYKVISEARKEGKLIEEVPLAVKKACERLIEAYSGDFLENVIKKHPDEFSAFQGRSSWVRKPFTQYRDYYLDALWYAAEYEGQQAQRFVDAGEDSEEEERISYQERIGRAALLYQMYAMYACNSKTDTKVTFGTNGTVGERIGMSERALRRCVVLLGTLGKTDLVNQIWSAYTTLMKTMSGQRWVPSKETVADVEAARAQTNAYRFPAQLFQAGNEPAEV